jgi:hypothetical protein
MDYATTLAMATRRRGAIPPSLGGYWPGLPVCGPQEEREAFIGKVVSIVYDRFGDFCGFVLDT